MSSGDEFDAYNFGEFTADDLASVDTVVEKDIFANRGGPAVTVEVEKPADHLFSKASLTRESSSNAVALPPTRRKQASPFVRYRWWSRVLSVSDLVSPAWYVVIIESSFICDKNLGS
jgi:hypothetical protein